jgi:hypothetical protein
MGDFPDYHQFMGPDKSQFLKILTVWKWKFWQFENGNFDSLEKENLLGFLSKDSNPTQIKIGFRVPSTDAYHIIVSRVVLPCHQHQQSKSRINNLLLSQYFKQFSFSEVVMTSIKYLYYIFCIVLRSVAYLFSKVPVFFRGCLLVAFLATITQIFSNSLRDNFQAYSITWKTRQWTIP